MRLALAVALFAVAAAAQAPVAYWCGPGTACVGTDGQPVKLGNTVQVDQTSYPDGGVARITPVTSNVPLSLLGKQARTSTQPDVILGGLNNRDGGQPIVRVVSGNHTVWSVSGAGVVSAGDQTATTLTATTVKTTALDAGYGLINGRLQVAGPLVLTAPSTGSCTLGGESPSVCPAQTVVAGTKCVCSNVGTSAAIAALGCAVSLSSTTLTITSANAATHVVNYHCF